MSLLAFTLKPALFFFVSSWLQERGGQESFLAPMRRILKEKNSQVDYPISSISA